jgi:hypothetical protein
MATFLLLLLLPRVPTFVVGCKAPTRQTRTTKKMKRKAHKSSLSFSLKVSTYSFPAQKRPEGNATFKYDERRTRNGPGARENVSRLMARN